MESSEQAGTDGSAGPRRQSEGRSGGKFTLAAVASTISAFVAVFGANWFNAAKLNIDQADLAMRYAQFARGDGTTPPGLEEKVFVMNAMAAAGFGQLAQQARREARDAQVRRITDAQLDEPVHPSLNIGIPGLTVGQLETILAFVNVFETGKIRGDYSGLSHSPEGAGGLSYGLHGFSLTSGALYTVVAAYTEADGARYADALRPYLDRIKARDRSLADDANFLSVLRAAGQDPVMQSTQLEVSLKGYFMPTFAKAQELGLRQPLSYAVVYDSYINSGRLNMYDRTVAQVGPLNGANEKEWIAAYVATRKEWLAERFPQLVPRMETFERLIAADNWSLTLPVSVLLNPSHEVTIRREDLTGDALVRANTDAVLKDALANDSDGAGFFERAGASLDAMFKSRKRAPAAPSIQPATPDDTIASPREAGTVVKPAQPAATTH
ncbi:MAG: hypothetical protein GC155_05210 [Alphaproteobacteria bacterium]|nr:hypothetical protein [Alphaproteobacteria bacterium]